jgi:hypothetical protein
MAVWLPLLIAIVGLVLYAFNNNAKVMAVALDCFWVGLLVFLLRFTGTFHP